VFKVSRWTHIAGIIRIDQIPIRIPQLSEEAVIAMFSENAPRGSEGGLTFHAVRTQVIEPAGFPAVWGSISITGDLRDFDNYMKVEEWLQGLPPKLKEHQALIRNAVINIDVEYGPCVVMVWNPRTDDFTTIDVPP